MSGHNDYPDWFRGRLARGGKLPRTPDDGAGAGGAREQRQFTPAENVPGHTRSAFKEKKASICSMFLGSMAERLRYSNRIVFGQTVPLPGFGGADGTEPSIMEISHLTSVLESASSFSLF